MSDISPIGRPDQTPGIQQGQRAQQQPAQNGQPARPSDQVELSNHSRLLSKLRDLPVREDLVNRVRGEIEAGRYETEAKLDQALEEMGEDLA